MSSAASFVDSKRVPSAVISDGALTVALWAVTAIGLTETYQLPQIGSTSARAAVATHDDSMTLSGVLVGPDRYRRKLELEQLADASKRGTAVQALTGGALTGLIVITAMTIRTDMQVQSLSFTASSGKREALDVSIALDYLPLPGSAGRLFDARALGVAVLGDVLGSLSGVPALVGR